jgi:lysophospholipase L1-like esterase
MKKVAILYVSIKPSPSRERLMPRMEKANKLIADFLRARPNSAFADVYHSMLTPGGQPVDGLFEEDKLHLNEKGYAIWQHIIQPYLHK